MGIEGAQPLLAAEPKCVFSLGQIFPFEMGFGVFQ